MCYKLHASVLLFTEKQPEAELLEDVVLWEEVHNSESTNKLTKSILSAVITVAKCLTQEKAILLSTACKAFLETYCEETYLVTACSTSDVNIETGFSITKFTSRWMLHQLILHLKQHLSFKCVHKKSEQYYTKLMVIFWLVYHGHWVAKITRTLTKTFPINHLCRTIPSQHIFSII